MSASKLKQVALELQQGGSGLLADNSWHMNNEFGPVDPLGNVEHRMEVLGQLAGRSVKKNL